MEIFSNMFSPLEWRAVCEAVFSIYFLSKEVVNRHYGCKTRPFFFSYLGNMGFQLRVQSHSLQTIIFWSHLKWTNGAYASDFI